MEPFSANVQTKQHKREAGCAAIFDRAPLTAEGNAITITLTRDSKIGDVLRRLGRHVVNQAEFVYCGTGENEWIGVR